MNMAREWLWELGPITNGEGSQQLRLVAYEDRKGDCLINGGWSPAGFIGGWCFRTGLRR